MNSDYNAPPRPTPDSSVIKTQTLWILLALAFVEGWFRWIIGEESSWLPLYTLLTNLVNVTFIVRWFVTDAAQHDFKLSRWWIMSFVLFALFAAPVYFFRTRGRAFWRPTGLALLFLLAIGVCAGLGAAIAQALKL